MFILSPGGRCVVDFVLDELPMSNIDSLELPAVPAAPDYKTVDLHSVFLPTHDLYSEMKGTMQRIRH